ncbi:hypothetical protein NMG60_11009716 [Bertholletia excelsa]
MDPIPPWLRRLWNAWDVRVLVLISFSIQIILYIFGSRRKYKLSIWITTVVWVAYLTADWVATIALSKLSDVQSDPGYDKANSADAVLHGLWAPLLLVHLGGPDTITAYSLEDNRLWLRHWLSLFVQAAVALYAIILSWRVKFWISFLTFPAFVTGITKCGERAWVLMLANRDDYSTVVPVFNKKRDQEAYPERSTIKLHMANQLLAPLKEFMEQYDLNRSSILRSNFSNYRGADIWEVMECELGLMYDILYTKASVIYTRAGFILRCISLVCTISLTVGFIWFISDKETWKDEYNISIPDIVITGALVIGTMVLEMYATILSLSTDWTVIWTEAKWGIVGHPFSAFNDRRRWSNMMGQFNLYEFWEEGKPSRTWKGSGLMLERHVTRVPVPNIRSKITDFIESLDSLNEDVLARDLCGGLLRFGSSDFAWGIATLHLITELLYKDELNLLRHEYFGYPAFGNRIKPFKDDRENIETCRILSNYVMYLLIMRSSMLPIVGVEEIRRRITRHTGFASTIRALIFTRSESMLPKRILDTFHQMIRDTASSSSTYNSHSPWVVLTNAWLAILLYTAKEFQKDEHLQQLRHGGELLTLLSFLLPQSGLLLDVDPSRVNANLNFLLHLPRMTSDKLIRREARREASRRP